MAPIAPARDDQREIRPMAQQIAELAKEVGPAVLIDGDVVHIAQIHLGLAQAICDSLRWKTCPMLHAAKAFLLGGSDQLAVTHDRRCRVAVEGVKTKDNHVENSQ